MPLIRELISVSQLAELLGVDPTQLVGVEVDRSTSTAQIVLEEREPEQASA